MAKKREIELTLEEALTFAKRELSPQWFFSKPLLYASYDEESQETKLFVLEEENFENKKWLILTLDPTEQEGISLLQLAGQWMKRYQEHDLNFLFIFYFAPDYLYKEFLIEPTLKEHKLKGIVFLDKQKDMSKLFLNGNRSSVNIQTGSEIHGCFYHQDIPHVAEKKLQDFLRLKDPGLSLEPPIQNPYMIRNTKDIFLLKDFQETPHENFKLIGNWYQNDDLMTTKDPHAAIQIKLKGGSVSLFGISRSPLLLPCNCTVTSSENPLSENQAGKDVHFDDYGRSILSIRGCDAYHLFEDEDAQEKEVTVHFSLSDEVPVGLLGLRFETYKESIF